MAVAYDGVNISIPMELSTRYIYLYSIMQIGTQ